MYFTIEKQVGTNFNKQYLLFDDFEISVTDVCLLLRGHNTFRLQYISINVVHIVGIKSNLYAVF